MVKLGSIRSKSIIYTLLIMIVPLIVLGAAGTLYYHEVIKKNIQNDYQEEARTIAALTANYLDRSLLFLEGHADSSKLISALDQKNKAALDDEMARINAGTELYYWTFVTDTSGRVLCSHPYGSAAGRDLNGYKYISEPLRTGKTYVGSLEMNDVTGRRTIIVGTPIEKNGTVIGVLAGALDEGLYMDLLSRAREFEPLQDIFLVNSTGTVVYSHDKSCMGWNLSTMPAAQNVIKGREGVDDNANLSGLGTVIAAYSPVPEYGLGAIIALPVDVAYQPVNDWTGIFAVVILVLTLVAAIMAVAVGNHIARPVTRIATAVDQVAEGVDISQASLDRYMPYDRSDELGSLARNFKNMADKINAAREKIMREKHRADMYIDVMGHDINNLNQIILANLELVQHYDQLDDRQREFLEGAVMATKESAEIVKNVKAIQAITAEKPELQPVDIDRMIQDCLRDAPKPAGKQVIASYQPNKGRIVRALPELKLAFCSVINNSIKYSGPEVHIDITVDEETLDGKKYYAAAIADDGNGIPDDVRDTLFTRFHRDARVPPGKGLGLYTAKALAEAFEGSLRVECRVPGDYTKGTKITIVLPEAEET